MIDRLPRGWKVVQIEQVTDLISGYSKFNSKSYVDNGIPIFRIGDLGGQNDLSSVKRVSEDDVPNLDKKMSHSRRHTDSQNWNCKKLWVCHRFTISTSQQLFDLTRTLVMKNTNLRETRDLLPSKLISGEIDVSKLNIDIEGKDSHASD